MKWNENKVSLSSSVLQLKDFRVDQWIKPCIGINTRELNRELLYWTVYLTY